MSDLGNKEIMSRNIRYYMDLNNKTRQEMCDALGVKYTTFTDWVNGNTYPRIDKIEMMANYFGIKKSDLVEERTPAMVKEKEPCTPGERCVGFLFMHENTPVDYDRSFLIVWISSLLLHRQ